MSKNLRKYFIIIAIVLVVYNLFVFLVPFPHKNDQTFYLAYIFGLIAIASQGYTAYLAFNKKDSLKSKFYGFPIVRLGLLYLVGQLFVSIILFIIGAFVCIPVWIVILICVILLALAVCGLIATDAYREEIEKIEKSEPITTKFIYDLRVDAKILIDKYSSSPLYNELYDLQQEIQYSDPKSNESLIEIEDEINRKFVELKDLLSKDALVEAKELTAEIKGIIKERNYRCKTSKQ